MTNWKYKIDLNGVISKANDEHDLTDPEAVCPDEVKEAIVAEINKAPPLMRYQQEVRKCVLNAEINDVLSKIFDSADVHLVWCGMPT